MALTESQALRLVRNVLGQGSILKGKGSVGIGDDAASLPLAPRGVWTVDACTEGAHFRFEWVKPEDVAHKSFHAALSDIPAMGAKPRAALSHLTLSRRVTGAWLGRFLRAQKVVAEEAGAPIVGGNVCFADQFSVVTSVFGDAPPRGALLRSTAKAGDEVWLVGDVGLARAGLLLLEEGRRTSRVAEGACLAAFLRPQARVSEGPRLVGRATACLDISDGLARDAHNLASASGVRIVLEGDGLQRALRPELSKVASVLGLSPIDLALQGGEDYALLATGPSGHRPRFARVIGHTEAGKGVFVEKDGKRLLLAPGFEHRAK